MNNYKKLRFPILLIEFYLIATVVLFAFGPWEWNVRNPILTYILLLGYPMILYLGYIRQMKKRIKKDTLSPISENKIVKLSNRALKRIMVLKLIITIFNVVRNLNLTSFSIGAVINQVIQGLNNPASQYLSARSVVTSSLYGGHLLSYVNVLLAPIVWIAIPLGIYHFKELSKPYKIIVVITILLEISQWIGTGTNKGLIDVILICLAIIVLKRSDIKNFFKDKVNKKKKHASLLFIIIFLIFGLYFFSIAIGDRVNSNWGDFQVVNGRTNINFESPIMKIVPKSFQATLIYGSSYLSQGYYGLSLTTTIDWVPMFGVGNSMFLMENIEELTGTNLFQYTYQARLEPHGWDSLVNWHSFYMWVANDVSLLGVFIIMYLLGMFLASVVFEALNYQDDTAIVLFCLLFTMMFYIPANNQILSYPTTFMVFWCFAIIFVLKRKIKLKWR